LNFQIGDTFCPLQKKKGQRICIGSANVLDKMEWNYLPKKRIKMKMDRKIQNRFASLHGQQRTISRIDGLASQWD